MQLKIIVLLKTPVRNVLEPTAVPSRPPTKSPVPNRKHLSIKLLVEMIPTAALVDVVVLNAFLNILFVCKINTILSFDYSHHARTCREFKRRTHRQRIANDFSSLHFSIRPRIIKGSSLSFSNHHLKPVSRLRRRPKKILIMDEIRRNGMHSTCPVLSYCWKDVDVFFMLINQHHMGSYI